MTCDSSYDDDTLYQMEMMIGKLIQRVDYLESQMENDACKWCRCQELEQRIENLEN